MTNSGRFPGDRASGAQVRDERQAALYVAELEQRVAELERQLAEARAAAAALAAALDEARERAQTFGAYGRG